jgi:hypothetical protein
VISDAPAAVDIANLLGWERRRRKIDAKRRKEIIS